MTKFIGLFKDCPNCEVASVNNEVEGSGVVRQGKYGCLSEGVFQEVECCVSIGGPGEWCVFLRQVKQWTGKAGVI